MNPADLTAYGAVPQHQGGGVPAAPVLTGASGMAMISEMFQRQASRLQSREQLQEQDKKAVEHAHAQLLVMQAQLHWHATRFQERGLHVTKSSETISRMQAYLVSMETEREKAVETALQLARDVNDLRLLMEASQPERLQTLSTTLSDMAMQGKDLSAVEGIGQLFASGNAAVASTLAANANAAAAEALANSRQASAALQGHVAQYGSVAGYSSAPCGGAACGLHGSGSVSSHQSSSRHRYPDGAGASPELHGNGPRLSSNSGGSQQLSNGSGSDGDHDNNGSSSNGHDHNGSSSDSADAASAASTWPHAVGRRRHSKDGLAAKHYAHAAADHRQREGSPPENDSSTKSDWNGEQNGEESPPLDPSAPATQGKELRNDDDATLGALTQGRVEHPPIAAAGAAMLPPHALHQLHQLHQMQGVQTSASGAQLSHAGLLMGLSPATLSGLANGHGAAGPASGGAAGGGYVAQGVLPFPGQGVVELQQGVLVGGALQEFFGDNPLPSTAAAASRASDHGAGRVPERAGGAIMHDNGYLGEPPPKRAAASSLHATPDALAHAAMLERGLVTKTVSRARAEFSDASSSAANMDTD